MIPLLLLDYQIIIAGIINLNAKYVPVFLAIASLGYLVFDGITMRRVVILLTCEHTSKVRVVLRVVPPNFAIFMCPLLSREGSFKETLGSHR